jgi:hypothetical protein
VVVASERKSEKSERNDENVAEYADESGGR